LGETRCAAVRTVCVFGAGLQARFHVLALLAVCTGIERIVIVNRSVDGALRLITQLTTLPPHTVAEAVSLDALDHVRAAVQAADIIVTATNASTPLFLAEDVKAGCHVNAVGSYTPGMQELPAALFARAALVVDCEEAIDSSGDVLAPVREGHLARDTIVTLGAFLHTPSPLPADRSISVFKSVGTACQDVVTAAVVFESKQ
jgi:ornithine cyclodeaminase